MKKKTKKNIKQFFGDIAKVAIGVAAGAAAFGMSPFDKGATARSIGSALTNNAGGLFHEIDKWVEK